MNFFNFILTRQIVLNKTDDADRANKLGLLTSFLPGPWGMMMGVVLASREEAPAKLSSSADPPKETPAPGRSLPAGKSSVAPS